MDRHFKMALTLVMDAQECILAIWAETMFVCFPVISHFHPLLGCFQTLIQFHIFSKPVFLKKLQWAMHSSTKYQLKKVKTLQD